VPSRDLSIPHADHAMAGGFEKCCTSGVVVRSVPPVVRVHVLATELQTEDPAISQQGPGGSLTGGRHPS